MTDYSKFIPTPKEWPAASPPPPAVEAQELIAEHMKLVDAYAVAYRAGEPVKDAYHAVQESARRLSKQPLVDPARSSAHATACPTSEQRSLDAVDMVNRLVGAAVVLGIGTPFARREFTAARQAVLDAADDAARLNAVETCAVRDGWVIAKNVGSFTAYFGRGQHATRATLRAAIDAAATKPHTASE